MNNPKTRLVVFDLETTNPPERDYKKHEIIEIAAIEIVENKLNTENAFYSLIKPPCKIQPHNYKVSGISNEMVKDAPVISEILPGFLKFIGDSPLIAHNIAFDAKVFNENLTALDYNQLPNVLLCTFVLSKKLYPNEKSHGLSAVIERLGIKLDTKQQHRALEDVEATAAIFIKFLEILKQHRIITLEDIDRLCNTDAEVKDFQQLKLF